MCKFGDSSISYSGIKMMSRDRRITPLRGSPIGPVILNDSETYNDSDLPISIPDDEFGEMETVCECGRAFDKHTPKEIEERRKVGKCPARWKRA